MHPSPNDSPQVRLHAVHYDTDTGRFEAQAHVDRYGITYVYPCRIVAPQTMPPAQVRTHLMARALRMSDSARRMMSHMH